MLVAHVGPAGWLPDEGLGTTYWQWEIFHSRTSAMFAVAAGLSLNLSSRVRRSVTDGTGATASSVPQIPVKPILIRSAGLLVIGVVLLALLTPAAVILPYFALWFVLATPLLKLSTKALLWTAGLWAVIGPPLSFGLRLISDNEFNLLWWMLVTGDYPTITWMPFLLLGVAIGRFELRSPAVRRRLLLAGTAIAATAYGLSTAFIELGGRALIVQSLPEPTLRYYAHLFYAETGITDSSTWLWLLTSAPHSGSWPDVWGRIGVTLILLALLLWLGDLATASSRLLLPRIGQLVLRAVATVGTMSLSVYAAHIVVMWLVTLLTGHSFLDPQPVWVLLAFTLGLLLAANLWALRFRRGPLEALLAKLIASASAP